jgi:hypothetical protein
VRPKLSWKTCYKTLVNGTLKGHQTPQFRLYSLLPLHEVVANNAKGVDVNYIKNFRSNAYSSNYNSVYPRPSFAKKSYGSWPTYVPNTTYASENNISNDLKTPLDPL